MTHFSISILYVKSVTKDAKTVVGNQIPALAAIKICLEEFSIVLINVSANFITMN